jgi:hypothetical protein
VWQAPLTPRLLSSGARRYSRTPATLGDILARLGCDDPAIVSGLVQSWRLMLDQLRPDLVIGEFAPFLLSAARGRVPSICFGQGFSSPPPHLSSFPSLDGSAPTMDEQAVLAATNQGLEWARAEPLPALPALFAADAQVAATFEELDPYRGLRASAVDAPILPQAPSELGGEGEEVFVYLPESVGADARIWDGLARSRLPIRVHQPRAPAANVERFAAAGFRFEPEPVSFDVITARSRLLLSHGGVGTLGSCLLAGLPQVICFYDLEKRLNGHAVAALGLGGHVPLHDIQPEPFAASLVRLYGDDALAARARAAAPGFRARMEPGADEVMADHIDALLRRGL